MQESNQSGFNAILVLVSVAVLTILGTIGWSVYSKKTQMNSQAQMVSQAQGVKAPTNSQSAVQQATVTSDGKAQTQSQEDPNVGYVVIKEWGVRFKVVEGLEDLITLSQVAQLMKMA